MYVFVSVEIRLIVPIPPKPINLDNYEHYLVSFWGGKVINTRTNNILNCWQNKNGYRRVRLSNGKLRTFMYVHRLVALTWLPTERDDVEVNHIDRVRDNCDTPNLEWMTRRENMEYKYNFHTKAFDEIEIEPMEECQKIEAPEVGVDEDLPF